VKHSGGRKDDRWLIPLIDKKRCPTGLFQAEPPRIALEGAVKDAVEGIQSVCAGSEKTNAGQRAETELRKVDGQSGIDKDKDRRQGDDPQENAGRPSPGAG